MICYCITPTVLLSFYVPSIVPETRIECVDCTNHNITIYANVLIHNIILFIQTNRKKECVTLNRIIILIRTI